MEQFANSASSTLSSGINSSVTSLTVASASLFPSSGNFRILIDTELLLVTAVSGTTFTVTRGIESTTGASHSSGATVTHVLTSGSLDQRVLDECYSDTYANRPSSVKAGKLFLPTDSPLASRDNGSGWDNWLLSPLYKCTDPTAPSWSWINQSSATLDTSKGTCLLYSPSNGGSVNVNARVKSAPATPYVITLVYGFFAATANYGIAGAFWRNSSSGNMHMIEWPRADIAQSGYGAALSVERYTSATVFNVSDLDIPMNWMTGNIKFLQIGDDGTNRYAKLSADGVYWGQVWSASRTTYITPDQVGFFVNPYNQLVAMNLLSWKEA